MKIIANNSEYITEVNIILFYLLKNKLGEQKQKLFMSEHNNMQKTGGRYF